MSSAVNLIDGYEKIHALIENKVTLAKAQALAQVAQTARKNSRSAVSVKSRSRSKSKKVKKAKGKKKIKKESSLDEFDLDLEEEPEEDAIKEELNDRSNKPIKSAYGRLSAVTDAFSYLISSGTFLSMLISVVGLEAARTIWNDKVELKRLTDASKLVAMKKADELPFDMWTQQTTWLKTNIDLTSFLKKVGAVAIARGASGKGFASTFVLLAGSVALMY